MKLKDHLPLKAVIEELGVSRWTLWRARASGIADFPEPTQVGRQLYWRKTEIEALESALLRFEGRCAFDRKRQHERRLKKLRTRVRARPRAQSLRTAQPDLFSA